MRAVDIGVRHDDDLVIPQLADIELVAPDAGAHRGNQRADFLRPQHPVEARPLDVQDLAAQRQYSLVLTGPALFGRPSGAVALYQEQFGLGGILFLTIGQFAGQGGDVHRRLAARQFARLAGSFAGKGGFDDFTYDLLGDLRIFLEPFSQLFVHEVFHGGPYFGRHQLVFRLA